jgi:hypothetical protein
MEGHVCAKKIVFYKSLLVKSKGKKLLTILSFWPVWRHTKTSLIWTDCGKVCPNLTKVIRTMGFC